MSYMVTCYSRNVSVMRTVDTQLIADEIANSLSEQHPECYVTVYRVQHEQLYQLLNSRVVVDNALIDSD